MALNLTSGLNLITVSIVHQGPTGAYYPRLLARGWGTPYDGLDGEASPERGIFSGFRYMKG